MEIVESNTRQIDTLFGVFSPQELEGVKSIWEVTEQRLKAIQTPEIKANYAKFGSDLMINLLAGLDGEKEKVIGKFVESGITGFKIGDQVVRIAEKPEDKEDVFLTR